MDSKRSYLAAHDTSAEATTAQVAAWRAMDPASRLGVALELSDATRELHERGKRLRDAAVPVEADSVLR